MAEPRKSGFPGKNARATKTFKIVGNPLCDIDSMSIYFGDLRNVRLHNATKDAAVDVFILEGVTAGLGFWIHAQANLADEISLRVILTTGMPTQYGLDFKLAI